LVDSIQAEDVEKKEKDADSVNTRYCMVKHRTETF
jgi:hypothetical protein